MMPFVKNLSNYRSKIARWGSQKGCLSAFYFIKLFLVRAALIGGFPVSAAFHWPRGCGASAQSALAPIFECGFAETIFHPPTLLGQWMSKWLFLHSTYHKHNDTQYWQ